MRFTRQTVPVILACTLMGLGRTTGICSERSEGRTAPSVNLEMACVSRYVWRGIPQTSGAAFQPSLTACSSNGLTFNFWASRDSDRGTFTESDCALDYAWRAGDVSLNTGCIYYAFPNTVYPGTSEVYLSAGFGGSFAPTVALNYDIDEADGLYASVSGSLNVPLGRGARSLALTGRLGLSSSSYNAFWFGVDSTAFSDLYLSAAVPFEVGEVTLTPSLSFCSLLSGKLRRSLDLNGLEADNLVLGLNASLSL